jgi:hypothetical protein
LYTQAGFFATTEYIPEPGGARAILVSAAKYKVLLLVDG